MKYKILITKIEEKEVVKNVYYPEMKNKGGGTGAYSETMVKENVYEDVYEQIREGNIDLMSVIKAFNEGGK